MFFGRLARVQSLLAGPLLKVALTLSMWFFLHHFCAGTVSCLDLHYGSTLEQARTSSKAVLAAGVILTLLFSALMW